MTGFRIAFVALALVSCLGGCGRASEEERILGHWQWAMAEAHRHPSDDAKFHEYMNSLVAECQSLKEKFLVPTEIKDCTDVLFAFDLQDQFIKDYKYGESPPQ